MTACIRLDQWILNVEYDYNQGDDYYSSGWLDLDVVSGMVEIENSEEMLAMTNDEMYACQQLFGNEIKKVLTEDFIDGN